MWLNAFPVKNGISRNFSAREIVLRHKLDYKKHCKVPFGTYCEVHEEPAQLNSMQPKSQGGIDLGPTGNIQGTYKFFSLKTGKLLRRRKFTALPMPDLVIKKVEAWGHQAVQRDGELAFADRNRIPSQWKG